jgi:hypothetical protein
MDISRVQLRKSIKSLYGLNLLEGEGVGTAYEYYTKLRKLEKFLNSIGRPKNILVAGLPEKYGLSMDFFLVADTLRAQIVVVDDRDDRLQRAREVFTHAKSQGYFADCEATFSPVNSIAKIDDSLLLSGKFDLALSSEVLQRLDGSQHNYISTLKNLAKYFALFVPNNGNESHADLSGLNSISLTKLLRYCRNVSQELAIYDYGYLDAPPFPPGLSRSQDKRQQAAQSSFESFLMKGLEVYGRCENILPNFIMRKNAHIVYVMIGTNQAIK